MIYFKHDKEELLSLLYPSYRVNFVKHVPAIKVVGRRVLWAMCMLNLLGTALACILAADDGRLDATGMDIFLAALYLAIMNGNAALFVLRMRQLPLHTRLQALPVPRLVLFYLATALVAFMAGAATLLSAADDLLLRVLVGVLALLVTVLAVLSLLNHHRTYQGWR